MYTFRMLGSISASATDDRDVDALLRQPKHVALLAYLALPAPGVWHRRDSVLGVFWGDLDQARARSALRSALYVLRRHLPDGALLTRGADELSLAPSVFVTDVGLLLEDVMQARYEQALARYAGDLLPGAYVSEAPVFERWLELERTRVRGIVCTAAAQLAEQLEQTGNLPGAIAAARRAAELSPDDEAATRRWIALLDRAGDRAGAFAVYERFRNHMFESFGVRPSAETVALLDAVRTRREPGFLPVAPDAGPAGPSAGVTASAETLPSEALVPEGPSPARRRRLPLVASLVGVLSLLAVVILQPRIHAAGGAPSPRALVVLPMINQTGDTALDYVATGIGAGVARRLQRLGGLAVRSGARSNWTDSLRRDYPAIARQYRATLLLKTTLRTMLDSLEVQVAVVDSSGTTEREVARRRFVLSGMRDVESKLAAAIAAGVFRQQIGPGGRDSVSPDEAESYRLTMQGTHLLLNYSSARRAFRSRAATVPEEARRLFKAAVELDPNNAAAHSGISSTFAIPTLNDLIPFDDGYRMTALAAEKALAMDSSQAAALANLAITSALKSRRLTAGLPLMDAAVRADPSNTETWVIRSALFRHAHLYDEARDAIRVARELDPFTSSLLDREATLEICAGNPRAALELYASELVLNATDPFVHNGMVRTLAMLGRYDDALSWWVKKAELEGDSARAREARAARGRDGYRQLVHQDGRGRRDALLSRRAQGMERISSVKLMQAYFASGDHEHGFAELARLEAARTPALFRLTCMPELDEVRSDPRFVAAVRRIGALPRQ
jgi:DNA-binding SARP family transcriptional activator/TolB-like protein